MSITLPRRAADAVRACYRRSALAQYGAALHADCEDCATAPDDVVVPAPRSQPVQLAPRPIAEHRR